MKRRDITLGEMQDECLKHIDLAGCKECPYDPWCGTSSPDGWDLTDPPRFTEAQMALLKALYGIGVTKIEHDREESFLIEREGAAGNKFMGVIEMDNGETLDLAELLGKENK